MAFQSSGINTGGDWEMGVKARQVMGRPNIFSFEAALSTEQKVCPLETGAQSGVSFG